MNYFCKAVMSVVVLVILAAGFKGCTKNDGEYDSSRSEWIPIVFDISSEGWPLTRGSRLGNDITKYGVYGIYGKKVFASNVVFSMDENGEWTQSKTFAAPSGIVSFYAVNASFAKKTAGGIMDKVSMNSSKQNFTYTVPVSSDEQFDLMYASSLNIDTRDSTSKMGLRFKPALAALNFTIINQMEEDYDLSVGGITVYNMFDSGVFSFSKTASNVGTWEVSSSRGRMERIFDEPFDVTRTKQYLVDRDSIFFVIPQAKTTKWKTKDSSPISTAEADADGHSYIKLLCKVKDAAGHVIFGSDSQYGEVFLPINVLKTTAGNTTTYAIKFTGGFNDSGLPMAFGSGFVIDVDPWTDGTETPEDIEF